MTPRLRHRLFGLFAVALFSTGAFAQGEAERELLASLAAATNGTLPIDEGELPAASAEELRLLLRLEAITMRTELEVTRLSRAGSLEHIDDVARVLRAQAERITVESYAGALVPQLEGSKALLAKIRWRALAEKAVGLHRGMSTLARHHGLGVLAGRIAGEAAGWAFVGVATVAGMPSSTAMAINQFFPTSTIGMGVGRYFQDYLLRKQTVRYYGGQVAWRAVQDARKEANRQLGLSTLENIVLPIFDGTTAYAVDIADTAKLDRWARSLGLRTGGGAAASDATPQRPSLARRFRDAVIRWSGFDADRLTFEAMRDELQRVHYTSPLFEAVLANRELPGPAKAALLLQDVVDAGDQEALEHLRSRFPNRFRRLTLGERPSAEVTKWVQRLTRARQSQEVLEAFADTPKGLRAKSVLGFWREVLLPAYATKLSDVDFVSYRRLNRRLSEFEALAQANPEATWGPDDMARFTAYFRDSILPTEDLHLPNQCARALMRALRF